MGTKFGIFLFAGFAALPLVAAAECGAPPAMGDVGLVDVPAAPAPPVAAARPALPACLQGLSGPEQENCDREVLAAYGAAINAWIADLDRYVRETNDYANAAARRANAAVAHAVEARDVADAALGFAQCEAEAIRNPG